jgi:hypothetical protein
MRRSLALFSVVLALALSVFAATIPSGTKLNVRIIDVSGNQFDAELVHDITVGDKVILPNGAAFLGETTEMPDGSLRAELVLIHLPKREYGIVTSTILVGGSKAAQSTHRRQDAIQSAADTVRGMINPRPENIPASPSSGSGSEVRRLVPQQILQFKMRKKVDIDEK